MATNRVHLLPLAGIAVAAAVTLGGCGTAQGRVQAQRGTAATAPDVSPDATPAAATPGTSTVSTNNTAAIDADLDQIDRQLRDVDSDLNQADSDLSTAEGDPSQ